MMISSCLLSYLFWGIFLYVGLVFGTYQVGPTSNNVHDESRSFLNHMPET